MHKAMFGIMILITMQYLSITEKMRHFNQSRFNYDN